MRLGLPAAVLFFTLALPTEGAAQIKLVESIVLAEE